MVTAQHDAPAGIDGGEGWTAAVATARPARLEPVCIRP